VSAPGVSIIIPVLNGEKYITACFNAISRLNAPRDSFEVLLIDNGSTDRTLELASGFGAVFKLKNFSFGGKSVSAVRNFGVQRSSGSVVAFLDADCLVSPAWLERGLAAFRSGAAITGCDYKIPEDSTWVGRAWSLASGKGSFCGNVDWLPAGNMFIKKAVFLRVGGFDESITSDEDCELCYRVRNLGYTIFSDPAVEVVHLGTPQTVSAFFKKELWHGRDVFKLFLSSGRSPKVVLFAFYYVAALAGAAGGIIIALAGRSYFPLEIVLLAMLFLPAALAINSVRNNGGYRYVFNLLTLYLLYGIARAMCIIDLSNWISFKNFPRS
jgi:glycosyltransferase involved in cell wall biosynthesis